MASHPRPPYTVAPALAASPYHALSVAAYLAANPTITNPLASAAVFSCRRSRADATAAAGANVDPAKEEGEGEGEEGRDDGGTRLLLVQRAPADFLPLRWELPGGSADVGPGGDENLVGAAVRELWEETGLVATEVRRYIGTREFDEGEKVRWRADFFEVGIARGPAAAAEEAEHQQQDGAGACGGRDPLVRLDPKEHVAHLWVSEAEVRAGRSGEVELVLTDPDWRRMLLRAFELHREGCGC